MYNNVYMNHTQNLSVKIKSEQYFQKMLKVIKTTYVGKTFIHLMNTILNTVFLCNERRIYDAIVRVLIILIRI